MQQSCHDFSAPCNPSGQVGRSNWDHLESIAENRPRRSIEKSSRGPAFFVTRSGFSLIAGERVSQNGQESRSSQMRSSGLAKFGSISNRHTKLQQIKMY